MNEKKTIIEAFDELSPRYERSMDNELQRFWGWSYESFVDKLIENTSTVEKSIVLDVATGTAVIPRKIIQKNIPASQIVGLDITYGMLQNGQRLIDQDGDSAKINLTCADAQIMPFKPETFDVVICGLALHHMDPSTLAGEMKRVLKANGTLTIADVGGASFWRIPGIRMFIRIAAFLYYLVAENFSRALTEAAAASNVQTAENWYALFDSLDFKNIEVTELPRSRALIPPPILMKATKR